MKFNAGKLRESHETFLFVVDVAMLGLVILNLTWLIFDTLFGSRVIQSTLQWTLPAFTHFYREQVHPDFAFYDLIFVSIFLTEFFMRWLIAIRRSTYHRWFFYPFVHWYDLLGCIPVGSFRWLRLLRIVSIVYRLQKLGVIDVSNTAFARFFIKYFNVLVEEVSDRVVINVLDGVQGQIRTGNPVMEKIVRDVLLPQKTLIVDWLISRVNDIADTVYQPRRDVFRLYVNRLIAESLARDDKVAMLDKVPVIGDVLVSIIETTVSDVVFNVVDQLAADIGHQDTDRLVQEITDVVIERLLQPSDELNLVGKAVLLEVIDVIKDEVRVQTWKIRESVHDQV